MHLRQRYQHGCLTRKTRTRGRDVWEFRYYETTTEGQRRRRSMLVGSVARYPTVEDVLREIEPLRLRLNIESRLGGPVTINALIGRYIDQELPERHSTSRSYLTVLNRWIKPRWGDYLLEDVKTVAVEQWLRSLQLAPKSKTHIRSLMHLLYQNARRWEMVCNNPIDLVRQSGRRLRIPRVLTAVEVRLLLEQLANDAGQPRWQETILQRQLKPAAIRAGIGKIGWHTFRHTYSTMLRTPVPTSRCSRSCCDMPTSRLR
jgi:integrase